MHCLQAGKLLRETKSVLPFTIEHELQMQILLAKEHIALFVVRKSLQRISVIPLPDVTLAMMSVVTRQNPERCAPAQQCMLLVQQQQQQPALADTTTRTDTHKQMEVTDSLYF